MFAPLSSSGPQALEATGELTASSSAQSAFGIFALTQGADSSIEPVNLVDISVTATGGHHYAYGIVARTSGSGSPITSIVNSGDMSVTSTNKYGYAYGIVPRTQGADSGIYSITNSGTLVDWKWRQWRSRHRHPWADAFLRQSA